MLNLYHGEMTLIIILFISIIFQLLAAIIAGTQIKTAKGNYKLAWICVSAALFLMIERRLAPLGRLLWRGESSNMMDAIFGTLISIFMLGGIYGIMKIFSYIEMQRVSLDKLARLDSLTGLDNRRSVLEKLEIEINRSTRIRNQFAVLMLDIDHFKSVNDNYGHAAGDRVICQLAEIMQKGLRNIDTCGRIGGEEFLILIPDTNLKKANIAAERLRTAVASHDFHLCKKNVQVTVSIGVTIPDLGKEFKVDQLLATVDKALYRAKKSGRNRVEIQ